MRITCKGPVRGPQPTRVLRQKLVDEGLVLEELRYQVLHDVGDAGKVSDAGHRPAPGRRMLRHDTKSQHT